VCFEKRLACGFSLFLVLFAVMQYYYYMCLYSIKCCRKSPRDWASDTVLNSISPLLVVFHNTSLLKMVKGSDILLIIVSLSSASRCPRCSSSAGRPNLSTGRSLLHYWMQLRLAHQHRPHHVRVLICLAFKLIQSGTVSVTSPGIFTPFGSYIER
jgi:hypothetical protein